MIINPARISVGAILLALLCAACAKQAPSSDTGMPGESYPTFTDNGAWCWFSDPRAIYYEGKHKRAYSGWVDSVGNIVVGYYDYESGEIATKTLHERLERDDHNNPSFLMDPEGKLVVFYSRHADRVPTFLARAVNPEDISEWEAPSQLRLNDSITYAGLSNTYTYANIARLSQENDKLFLFWRGADFKPNVSVSTDFGHQWSTGKILVLPDRTYRNRRPYMKVTSNGRDAIHFAFTDGHPRDEPTNSIYYVKYKDGALFRADGSKIADWKDIPITPEQADMVYDAKVTKERAWVWDIAETQKGQPVIVYARFPSDSNHVYYYSIYAEGHWNNHRMVDSGPWFPQTAEGKREREPNYSGGIVLDHNDPSQVYLSREKNGVFEIEKWSTTDEGKTWQVTEVTKNSTRDNVRPYVISNHPESGPKVLWMSLEKYHHYTDFRAAIKMDAARMIDAAHEVAER